MCGDGGGGGSGEKTGTASADTFARVLLSGSYDLRHVFESIVAFGKHVHPPSGSSLPSSEGCTEGLRFHGLEFTVHEDQIATVGRQLLLFALALDDSLGFRERTETFLEVFGNLRFREPVIDAVDRCARTAIDLVARQQGPLVGLVDVSALKFKERDELEAVLRSYFKPASLASAQCDCDVFWDERLRNQYKDRYDYRENLVDWDLQMVLKEKASILHPLLFSRWRMTGQAFEYRNLNENSYVWPNRTIVVEREGRLRGQTVHKLGYFGDILQSPYLAVGVQCDVPDMYRKQQEQHVKSSLDIAEYNVTRWIVALEHLRKASSGDLSKRIRVRFWLGDLSARARKHGVYFDILYLSMLRVHLLSAADAMLVPRSGICWCDTAKFMLELKPEHRQEFVKKVQSMAAAAGWSLFPEYANIVACLVPPVQGEELAEPSFLVFRKDAASQS